MEKPVQKPWYENFAEYRAPQFTPAQLKCLTAREREIVSSVGTGLTDKAAAMALGLSEYTVGDHLHRIFEKLSIANRTLLTHFAIEAGLLKTTQPEPLDKLIAAYESLTPRERQVFHYRSLGKSEKDTATILSLSDFTVRDYQKEVYRKMNVSNTVELACKWIPLRKQASQDLASKGLTGVVASWVQKTQSDSLLNDHAEDVQPQATAAPSSFEARVETRQQSWLSAIT